MRRRDFLRMRVRRPERLLEISCEQLYAEWLGGDEPGSHPVDGLAAELNRQLRGVDVLRVVDREWLSGADDDLRRSLGYAISDFRARGGRVEYAAE